MLNNKDAIYIIIIAIVLGISFAVVWANLQRSAISKFIKALISHGCSCSDGSLTANELNLKGINKFIIENAVKKQNGLKRIISCEIIQTKKKDEAEILLYGNKPIYKYFFAEEIDINTIEKKYGYAPLSPLKVFAIIILIAATTIIAIKAVDIYEGFVSSKSSDSEQTQDEKQDTDNNHIKEDNQNSLTDDSALSNSEESDKTDSSKSDVKNENDNNQSIRPSIPMGPTK